MSAIAGMQYDPSGTGTLEDFIKAGDTENISYHDFSVIHKCQDNRSLELSITNVVFDYFDVLKAMSQTVKLKDMEWHKYRYRPKLLAYDIYGATELHYILMAVNGLYDIKDFLSSKKLIRMPYKTDLFNFLNKVYAVESKYIDLQNKKESKG